MSQGGFGGGAAYSFLPRGAITHPDEIERRLTEAVGSLCLVTAGEAGAVHYRRQQARIAQVGQGKVQLAFLGKAPVHDRLPLRVDLEVIHESAGLLRFHTMALAAQAQNLILSLPSKLTVDRRRWPRVNVRLTAQMSICDAQWQEQESRTVRVADLSPVGAAFLAETPTAIGTRLIFRLDSELPPVRAQVVRTTEAAGRLVVGVVFIAPDPSIRQFVLRLMSRSS